MQKNNCTGQVPYKAYNVHHMCNPTSTENLVHEIALKTEVQDQWNKTEGSLGRHREIYWPSNLDKALQPLLLSAEVYQLALVGGPCFGVHSSRFNGCHVGI